MPDHADRRPRLSGAEPVGRRIRGFWRETILARIFPAQGGYNGIRRTIRRTKPQVTGLDDTG